MDGLLSAHNKVKSDVLYRVMLLALTLKLWLLVAAWWIMVKTTSLYL